MFQRIIKPLNSQSFFLFGARGTGKSTFLQKQFSMKTPFWVDLLDSEQEDLYVRNPKRLEIEIQSRDVKPDWVVIDEIQKAPKLLDLVHRLIENNNQKFILTGSSARKLKRGAANLLAGRAFVNHLFPLTYRELSEQFNLGQVLQWGTLPRLYSFANNGERRAYLKTYALTYLKEEVQVEGLLRNLDPFRDFLEVAAQCSGKILSVSNISRDVGADHKTVQNYFQILEETWIGFYLPIFHNSVRKSQKVHPKFYFFDLGVKNSLAQSIDSTPVPKTSFYGDLFEHFLILEIFRLNNYTQKDYKLSYFQTKNGAEVDLILSRERKNILVEIKSDTNINEKDVSKLDRIAREFRNVQEIYFVSQNTTRLKIQSVTCLFWRDFLEEVF